jgi:branched-chain amino acid transport system substrate-binding protein
MRQSLRIAAAASLAAVIAGMGILQPAGTRANSLQAKKTYHAGANLCLTGAAGELGGHMRDGMLLAAANLNKASKTTKLMVDVEDSAANPQQGVTVFNDLVQNKNDPIVFTCGTTVIQATLPLAARNKTLMLNTSAGGPDLIGASPWLFNDFINTRLEAQMMANYMWKTLKLKTAAVDYRSDAYGSETYDAFKAAWSKLGGKVTIAVSHDINAPDQLAQVAKIKAVSSTTQALYIMSAGRDAGIFIKEARDAGLTQPIVGIDGVVSQAMLAVAGSAADGVRYTAAYYNLKSKDPITKEFNKTYKAKYGSVAPNTFFTSYYEGVLVWSQLITYIQKHHLAYNGTNLRQAMLKQKTFKGLGGSNVTFGKNGSAKVSAAIGVVANGSFDFVRQIKPPKPAKKKGGKP